MERLGKRCQLSLNDLMYVPDFVLPQYDYDACSQPASLRSTATRHPTLLPLDNKSQLLLRQQLFSSCTLTGVHSK